MPQYTITIAVFIYCLFFSLNGRTQTLETTLDLYAEKYTEEKAYIHYDKSSYMAGETIWFKLYLMQGLYPAEESKTVYVDWLDEKGTVLAHSACPILEASSNGNFLIPENYKGNFIHVRAYTRWMLNFDSAFLYNKDIRVLAKNPVTASSSKNTVIASVQFFPEGGDAIAGLKNRLAFKATDQWGRPVRVNGTIVDKDGVMVESFRSTHNGMGSFLFIPQNGNAYTAKWKDEQGQQHTTALPLHKPTGISLKIAVAGTRRILAVERSETAAENLSQLHVIGTMFQNKVFVTTVDLSSVTTASKTIPTETLPTGILTVTVFDKAWNAIAERITYVKNDEYAFQPELNIVRYGLNKRARNEWEITIPDSLVANLSIAVTDAAIDRDSSENIFSQLLLTSDLKGQVYKPASYFLNNSDSVNQQLDLVMLTNGWRRFKWEDVAKGKYPSILYTKDTAYLSFSGKIYGVQPGQLSNENMIAIVKTKDSAASQMLVIPIKPDGTFQQPGFVFFDTLQVFFQVKKSTAFSGSSVRFMENRLGPINMRNVYPYPLISSPFYDTLGLKRHAALAQEKAELDGFLNAKMLTGVTVTARLKSKVEELDKKYASGLFAGSDSYQFDLTDDKTAMGSMNIFNYLQGRVAGLQINNSGSDVTLQWRGGSPSVYLDQMPTDVSMISSLPVSDIAYIKVFRPPFMGGFNGSGGAIAIYTKKGSDLKASGGKGLDNSVITGYTPIKEFYSPNYDSFDRRNEQRDLRTTLYWAPFLTTAGKQNSIKLKFYNTDVTQAFRVVIEGMTKDGRLAHLETIVE